MVLSRLTPLPSGTSLGPSEGVRTPTVAEEGGAVLPIV